MLFNNQHPPLEISPTDQRVWKEHPITRAFVFSFRPIQNQTWIQRQTAGWGRSNSACLSSALAKSSWSSSLRRGGLITRLIRHHTFSSLSQTPASAQSCQMCRRGRRNKTPSRPITRLNRTRFSWHLFTTENFDYEKSTREIQEDWRTGFPFPLPEILFFDFFFLRGVTVSDNWPWNWYEAKKKRTSKWNRSCQGNFAKPAAVRDNRSHATFKLWESSAEQFILKMQKEKGRFMKKAPSNPRPWKEQLNNRDLTCFLSVY